MNFIREIQQESEKELHLSENIKNVLNIEINENLDKTEIEESMVKGDIPIGFSDAPLWQSVKELVENVSDKIQNFNNQSRLLEQEEQELLKKIKLEERLQDIQVEKKKNQLKIQYLKELTANVKLPLVRNIIEVEEKTTMQMDNQMDKNAEKFSSWNGKNSKLTLIFNAFGFPKEIIEKLGDVDGEKLNFCNIFDLCEDKNIGDLKFILDLAFIKMMMFASKSQSLPTKTHFEQCPVCICDTPNELKNLLVERNFELAWEILSDNDINGRRFISTPDWIKKFIPKQDRKQYNDAVLEMQRLHSRNR